MLEDFTESMLGLFYFLAGKSGTPGSVAIRSPLPFVHTAGRYYGLDGLVWPSDPPRRVGPRPWQALRRRWNLTTYRK